MLGGRCTHHTESFPAACTTDGDSGAATSTGLGRLRATVRGADVVVGPKAAN